MILKNTRDAQLNTKIVSDVSNMQMLKKVLILTNSYLAIRITKKHLIKT